MEPGGVGPASRWAHLPSPPVPHRLPAMFEAQFQSFDDPQSSATGAAPCRAPRPNWHAADLTASSCRAPTAIRTNICRRPRSGSPGSPASPARPAPASCSPSARCCSSTAATRCRRATRSMARLFAIVNMRRDAAGSLDRTNLPAGAKLGYDPWLHTTDRRRAAGQGLQQRRARRWSPPSPTRSTRSGPTARRRRSAPVTLHDLRFAGEDADAKLARIRAEIAKLRADALVVSDPHAVAWTFNIRGADVAHTPLPLAFAIVPQRGPARALYRRRASSATRCAHKLEELADVREPDGLRSRDLTALGSPASAPCGSIRRPPPMRCAARHRGRRQDHARSPIRSR